MSRDFDITVVGAGMTGLCAALLLASGPQRRRLRVRVLDAGAAPRFDPDSDPELRVSAISTGSVRLLERCAAWPHVVAARCCPYDRMRVWDAKAEPDGPTTLHFDASEFAVPHLGYIVENTLLRVALLTELDKQGVDVRFDTGLDKVELSDSGIQRVYAGNHEIEADLVIAADGGSSRVREEAGLGVRRDAYAQDAFVTHVEPEHAHSSTAWQRFLPGGPVALLPLDGGRVSVVWSASSEQVTTAMQASDEELGDLLTEATDGVLGRLCRPGPRGRFALSAMHADQYVRHGVALLGDAAHTVHPLAGQGANLGLADASALARIVGDAVSNGEYPGDRPVLRRYERERRGENAAMLHFLTALNRLFAADMAMSGRLRRAGMALFNRSGPLRQRMAGVALGQGDRS